MKLERMDRGEVTKVNVRLDFDELTPLQIAALRAINDNRLDFENTSDAMDDVLQELRQLNLLDHNYDLTQTGEKAVRLAIKLGSAERRRAQELSTINAKHDELTSDDVYDDGDEFQGLNDEDISDTEMNRFGSPNQNY
jgi:hypothetical protein